MDDKIDQREVAEYLGISTKTVRKLIRRGELPRLSESGRNQFWLKDRFTGWLRDGGAVSVRTPCAGNIDKLVGRCGRPRSPT
jgi:predicted DNA-binding transcriptional regulator AlpA